MSKLRLELRVELRTPSGEVLDLTERVDVDDLGTLSESYEEDLLEQVHGDIDFDLEDADGAIAALFDEAKPSDLFEVVVYREGRGRRADFERLFSGILDLPWSVQIDRKDQRVTVQAFSNSKRLERASAETIRRTVEGRTITTTAASATATVSDRTDILAGDEITATDEDGEETQIVRTVSGTSGAGTLTTLEPWSRVFAVAALTLETPYHRNKTIDFLAGECFETAGITSYEINVDEQPLAEYPIATELNTNGLTLTAPRSLVDEAGQIVATFASSPRKVADSPQSGFAAGAASTTTQGDWRPYLLAEPTTIMEFGTQADGSGEQVGSLARTGNDSCWDHTGGRTWNVVIQTGEPPPADPDGERSILTLGGPDVTSGQIDFYDSDVSELGYPTAAVEYNPVTDDVWVSYIRGDGSAEATIVFELTADTQTAIASLGGGQLRCVIQLGAMAWAAGGVLKLLDLTTQAVIATGTCPVGIKLWSLRYLDGQLLALYTQSGKSRLRVWDALTLEQMADYEVASNITGPHLLTVFSPADGTDDIAVGYAGGQWFVLAKTFAGVIAYADFEGLSVAAALRELALVSLAVVTVDHHGTGRLRSRTFLDTSKPELVLPDPLEQTSTPVWELYAASVTVRGKTEDGEDVQAIAGTTGDSAHSIELDARLVTNDSQAQIVGAVHHGFLSVVRRQEDVTVDENEMDDLARPFERLVRMGGRRYLVLEAETDLVEQEQDLRLVEV